MAKYKLDKYGLIGLAIGSFIFGTQILHLIGKITNNQNYSFEAIICLIGLIIAGISLYFINKLK